MPMRWRNRSGLTGMMFWPPSSNTSTASVNSALQRARKAIASTAPTQQTVLRDLGDAAVDDIVTRWTDAWHAGDVDAIVAMLADDARYSMPPLPVWYRGKDEIRAFLLRGPLQSRWQFLPTTANGQLAFGTYLWDSSAGAYVPGGLDVLTLLDGYVADIVASSPPTSPASVARPPARHLSARQRPRSGSGSGGTWPVLLPARCHGRLRRGAPQHGRADAHARNQQRVMHDHRKVTSIASLARSMSPARNHGVTPARSR